MTTAHMRPEPIVTGEPDLDAVVATLTASFAQDPIIEWAIPTDTPERSRYLDSFFAIVTEDILDRGGMVATSSDYDAVVVWTTPTDAVPTVDESAVLLDRLESATGPTGHRVRVLMELLDEHHPTDLPPHCHVMFAAVRAHSRGTGARAAVTGALRELRLADGVGVYAEASSERSLRLWERLGLSRVGSEIVLPDGGPKLFPLFAAP
ncbi:hypothetical protein O4214_15000 [Rhodococcus erythropolis]|uniref:hypothetical protein n=1 Tax=Rhodococcus erythropolis TaxID=1833 RepID=UPI001E4C18C8|nr:MULTISPECIES: hypothetical protein [Rhodococcus erythropolis group]MCD2104580.1 hypothetical protein [Rhodococcus qingshengii]MCZ4525295.1 hypothetical protein [Rhodococcus erythropolis]